MCLIHDPILDERSPGGEENLSLPYRNRTGIPGGHSTDRLECVSMLLPICLQPKVTGQFLGMNFEYLLYLEKRLRLREQSRSYRWTRPARIIWDLLHPHHSDPYEQRFAALFEERFASNTEDFEVIRNSGLFNGMFACPWHEDNDSAAILDYLDRWKRGFNARKPMPGFHPGIYADSNPLKSRDSFAHFVSEGRPKGPWLLPVISEKSALASGVVKRPSAALHLHLYYPDQLDGILRRLRANQSTPDLFISVKSDEDLSLVEGKVSGLGERRIVIKKVPNRGRNFAPLLTGFREIFSEYEIFGHLHAKHSPHIEDRKEVETWGNFLWSNLLGDQMPMMDAIIGELSRDPSLGLVFPDDPNVFGWGDNEPDSRLLAARMGMGTFHPSNHINFPAGSMFWGKTMAFKPLLDLNLSWEDYPAEPVGHDGTVLHAMERLIPEIVRYSGFHMAVTHVEGVRR